MKLIRIFLFLAALSVTSCTLLNVKTTKDDGVSINRKTFLHRTELGDLIISNNVITMGTGKTKVDTGSPVTIDVEADVERKNSK